MVQTIDSNIGSGDNFNKKRTLFIEDELGKRMVTDNTKK